jgi:hypothetical protein
MRLERELEVNNAAASSTPAISIPKVIDVAARRQELETPGA